MFDLPDAKRVRRSDLYKSSRSPSPASSDDPELDTEIAAKLQSHFESLYATTPYHAPAPPTSFPAQSPNEEDIEDEDNEQEIEFRLFSAPAGKTVPTEKSVGVQKIILEDESNDEGEGGFVRMKDPRVWVTRKAEGERLKELHSVAISGEDILIGSRTRNWGLEVPWRVDTLKVIGKKELAGNEAVVGIEDIGTAKRKKPGKKRRIVFRERKKKFDEIAEKKRKEMEEKGEAEREKRTRRNREKKVKRKMKEKAKKAGEADEEGDIAMKSEEG